jgi:class 3 adenylate cyclase/tetratricopeptide (TPR) repeat protein
MSCAAPLSVSTGASDEVRKTVTIVFCDIVGSTSMGELLDPETVRRVMARFFDEMRAVLERHGGVVEKFIGDAVMAVFGIPIVHEDDALRGVRAAVDMRRALLALNEELEPSVGFSIVTRTGVNTGEVVVGDSASGRGPVVGECVNVAARLQQSASPGDILLGADTYALVRESVVVDDSSSLVLKGKRVPVSAYPLIDVVRGPAEPQPRPEPPLVGRERELRLLHDVFDRVRLERTCHLVTTLGSAGVGKSRLAHEFIASVGDEATVLRGRCLPYGEGITFWPIADLVKQAAGIVGVESRDAAIAKLDLLVAGADDARLIAERVGAAIGLGDVPAVVQETFWAIRRLLQWIARERPLVAVVDDIQWAEPTFLDLLEHLTGGTVDAPILLLCPARSDLLDARPAWMSGPPTTTTFTLGPLDRPDAESLTRTLLGGGDVDPDLQARIAEAGGGNPLFVEELLRMLREEGLLHREPTGWVLDAADVPVPPSIHALLSARLDRLSLEEQAVIRGAAVIGKVFWWGAVEALVPGPVRPGVGAHLQTLVRRELISPERSSLGGEEAFRFHHILIQEAAYRSASKAARAEMHERFASWIERTTGERIAEYEEIIGYHLERASRYRRELGLEDERTDLLSSTGADRLATAGRRALARGDVAASTNLLERALGLLPSDDPRRLRVLSDLGEALMESGDFPRADELLTEAVDEAVAAGDRGEESHARVVLLMLKESTDPQHLWQGAFGVLERVIAVFEELGDDRGLARSHRLLADLHWTRCRYAEADRALRRATEHASRAGAAWEEAESQGQRLGAGLYGPTPVADVVRRCEEILTSEPGNRTVQGARALRTLGALRAMQGRFDEAREHLARSREILDDLGLKLRAAFGSEAAGFLEMLAGDPAAAERELRSGYEALERLGERGSASTVAALLAHAVAAQGRFDEAERFSIVAEEIAAEDDLSTQVMWRSARAKVFAARGRHVEADRSAREALKLAVETDDLNMHADTLMDLAEVLRLAGREAEAGPAAQEALELYRQKGNLVSAERAESLLEGSSTADA